jgi:hypothetical protein
MMSEKLSIPKAKSREGKPEENAAVPLDGGEGF